jgi:hypothetical protein
MDGEGCLIQVALELETGLRNEIFIFGLARNGRQFPRGKRTNPFQVDVKETIGTRQQARRLRRSVLAEGYDQRKRRRNQQNS